MNQTSRLTIEYEDMGTLSGEDKKWVFATSTQRAIGVPTRYRVDITTFFCNDLKGRFGLDYGIIVVGTFESWPEFRIVGEFSRSML